MKGNMQMSIERMKVINITEPGEPDVLQAGEADIPALQNDEVLIKVHAAGINRPDIFQRKGFYPPPPGASEIPGLEVAGEIIKSTSDTWKAGDKVCALIAGGGYAEYAAAPAGQCLPLPDGYDMTEAAALPETVFTVWNNLFMRGALKKDETALIHGGTSGIGTTAIQMAKIWGAKTIITAGSDEKCEAALKIGADHAINYKTQDFAAEVLACTNDKGVNVVLDMVGGDYVAQNIKCMAEEGRHVTIAHLNGPKAEISMRDIMLKRLVITGSTLRPRPIKEKEALAKGIEEHIWPHVVSGTIKPVMHKVFELNDAAAAHREMESGHHIGKIVLKVI